MNNLGAVVQLAKEESGKIKSPDERRPRRRKIVAGGKILGVLLAASASGYFGLQKATSGDAPTRDEVQAIVAEAREDQRSIRARVSKVELELTRLTERLDSLDSKVSESLKDLKEEIRYLARRRR